MDTETKPEVVVEADPKPVVEAPKKHHVLYFTAPWCGPCKQFKPHWATVAESGSYPNLEFTKLEVDDEQELAGKFEVKAIPTMIFLTEKGFVRRTGGATEKGFRDWLDQCLRLVTKKEPVEVDKP